MCLLPGLHAWFDLYNFVRDMDDADGDFSRLWVVLSLKEVIYPILEVTAQLCLWQPCVGKPGNTF